MQRVPATFFSFEIYVLEARLIDRGTRQYELHTLLGRRNMTLTRIEGANEIPHVDDTLAIPQHVGLVHDNHFDSREREVASSNMHLQHSAVHNDLSHCSCTI